MYDYKSYSNEKLIEEYQNALENYYHLCELLEDNMLSGKHRREREEDKMRYSQRIENLEDEALSRGLITKKD